MCVSGSARKTKKKRRNRNEENVGEVGLGLVGRKSLFFGMFTDIKYFLISLAHTSRQ